MSAASSPNDENDRTGAINRIFKYVHAARDAGQRLKKKNRTPYYALLSRYCRYFCRDNPFSLLWKPGRGMNCLPRPVLSSALFPTQRSLALKVHPGNLLKPPLQAR